MAEYNQESEEIQYLNEKDPILGKRIEKVGNLSYRTIDDGFSFLVGILISQLLSAEVADLIERQLKALCQGSLDAESVSNLSVDKMVSIGISSRKAQIIKELAIYCQANPSFFESLVPLSDLEVMKALTSIKGIGPWTAKMYMIFVLDRLDVLPFEDNAFKQAYRHLYKTEDLSSASIQKRCEVWSPYASLASRYMYKMFALWFSKEASR
jgi:DNA-3-methyladenine glycosylase II